MVQIYADLIEDGIKKISDVKEKIRNKVINELIERGREDLISD